MNEQSGPEDAAEASGSPPVPSFRARRRLDEVFGEILPTVTGDERDPEPAEATERERWYRENRPPHHG